MISEIGDVNFEDRNLEPSRSSSPIVSYPYHENIFAQHGDHSVLTKSVAFSNALKEVEQRTQQAAKIAPMGANVTAKTEVTIEWGGKQGTSINGSVSGSVSDNKGNKTEVRVQVERDGSGKATISAEHEKKSRS